MKEMKHKIKLLLPVEKRGLLGFKKTVMGMRTVEVDGKTYRKIKDQQKKKPYSIEEMMLSVYSQHDMGPNWTRDVLR